MCQCLPSAAVGGRVPRVRAYVDCACRSACPWWVFACVRTCLHMSCMCLNARMYIFYVRVYFMCTRAYVRCVRTSILSARIHVCVCMHVYTCAFCARTHVFVYTYMCMYVCEHRCVCVWLCVYLDHGLSSHCPRGRRSVCHEASPRLCPRPHLYPRLPSDHASRCGSDHPLDSFLPLAGQAG